jgi:phosphoribosylanthranilate isomerase
MLVKICGLTRMEDAQRAVECGANALGFVFWPNSPRAVDPALAREIVSALPPFVTPVGVFVNQSTDDINAVAAQVGLGAIQLHGDETIADANALIRPVLKAIALAGASVDAIDLWPDRTTLLLDAHDPSRRGGTGRTVDWEQAAIIARRRRIVLAGGLTPDNVSAAIARVRPFGIDVSSGVECAPGVKDHGRLKGLFEAITGAEPPQRTQWTQR